MNSYCKTGTTHVRDKQTTAYPMVQQCNDEHIIETLHTSI